MRKNLLFTLLFIFIFTFSAFAQTGKPTDKKSDKSSKQTDTAPKAGKYILSFKNTDKMFQILDGDWSYLEIDCKNPITIKVSKDRKSIKLIYPKSEANDKSEYVFVVSEVGSHYIRGQYEGEKRLTEAGKLEVWDFMFTSEDEFVWHREDWKNLGVTPPVTRCKEDRQIALLN